MPRQNKIISKTSKRPLSSFEEDISDTLSAYAQRVSGDTRVSVQYRDISDHKGIIATANKDKVIIGYMPNTNEVMTVLQNVMAVRNALYSLDEPQMFSEHGFNFIDTNSNAEVWNNHNRIRKEAEKKVMNSPAYKKWFHKMAGCELISSDISGAKIFKQVPIPSAKKLISENNKWKNEIDNTIEAIIEEKRANNSNIKLVHQLDSNNPMLYVSSYMQIKKRQSNSIKRKMAKLKKDTDLTLSIKGEIEEIYEHHGFDKDSLPIEVKIDKPLKPIPVETNDDAEALELVKDLIDLANNIVSTDPDEANRLGLNEEKLLEFKDEQRKSVQQGTVQEFADYICGVICDPPSSDVYINKNEETKLKKGIVKERVETPKVEKSQSVILMNDGSTLKI